MRRLTSQLGAIRAQVLVMEVKCANEDLASTAGQAWQLLTGANTDRIETAKQQAVPIF